METIIMTLKTVILTPAVLAVMLATTAAHAQSVSAEIDVNGDGMYSFPEVMAAMPDMTEDTFGALDVNGDGLLDADEIAVGVDAGVLPGTDG
jgi:opacity protein-like surface antigen